MLNEINSQARKCLEKQNGVGDMVQPGIVQKGRNGRQENPYGKWKTVKQFGNDDCDMEARETTRATLSAEELGERENRNSPLDGPRPRTPVPFTGDYR